jgi:hypothetical protein
MSLSGVVLTAGSMAIVLAPGWAGVVPTALVGLFSAQAWRGLAGALGPRAAVAPAAHGSRGVPLTGP